MSALLTMCQARAPELKKTHPPSLGALTGNMISNFSKELARTDF